VNEAVDRLIAERERLDAGLPGSALLSLVAHLVLIGIAVVGPRLLPQEPALRVADGFAVVLPRGGGGAPAPRAAPPKAPPATAPPATVAPAVAKPPREAPPPRAVPDPAARKAPRRPEATPAATGAAADATPGLDFAPAGPGVPEGTDSGGDWYLATVQQKIWLVWNQQIKSGFDHPIGVTFTILADGRVSDVRVTQPSGSTLLDLAAQRAVFNAAPFGPLPREYGATTKTILAIFRPTS
jgi:TonB family protein